MAAGVFRSALAFLCALLMGCAGDEVAPRKLQAMETVSRTGPIDRPAGVSEVWSVRRGWSDLAEDGVSYEDKYSRWIDGMGVTDKTGGGGKTFVWTTPYDGRQLEAPRLDCAEVAYLLRIAFASWFHLPFYVQGWDAERRQPVYAGHMGFVDKNGQPLVGFPHYRDRYADHQDSWSPGDPWPRDEALRKRRLGDDDRNIFLEEEGGEELGAGAYFDELFLNKRVGHFARLLLVYYGSINLADGSNMFHVTAESIRAGDVLLKRDKRQGSGHTVPILKADRVMLDKLAVNVASGNVPRRQPKWEDTAVARWRFTSRQYGGHGENSKGVPYAKLGGGLRRWRSAMLDGSRWYNRVPAESSEVYITDGELERLAERVDIFDEMLLTGSPEEREATALTQIESAREHLQKYPASCSARNSREKAFEMLYEINATHFDKTKADVDAEHRTLADYVLSELLYEQSKTCCWNKSSAEMHDIIMSLAKKEQAAAEAQQICVEPTVFRFRDDGYSLWINHAIELDRAEAWVVWSADEHCPWQDVSEDTVAERQSVGWCD